MSRVSVIVPNYNRESLVGETIANLLAQTQPPFEVIVVDDGSTDKSVDVIRSFGDKVKLIQQVNQGPGAARNAGLKIATGEFIQFQDSDDLFSVNKLEVQSKLLAESGADIAFSPWVKLNIQGQQAKLEDHVLQQAMPPANVSLACWWLRGWSTVFQSLLFRRSFLDKIGGYRTDLVLGEDGELFFRMLTGVPRVAFSPDALTLYRLHNVNKLTQDEGMSRSRRVVDWARCLMLMIQQCEASALRMDWVTNSMFLAGIRKHLGYLQKVPDAPPDLVQRLSNYAGGMPRIWLLVIGASQRLAERVRLQVRGSRWMPAYRAGSLSEHQRLLIAQAGLFLN